MNTSQTKIPFRTYELGFVYFEDKNETFDIVFKDKNEPFDMCLSHKLLFSLPQLKLT